MAAAAEAKEIMDEVHAECPNCKLSGKRFDHVFYVKDVFSRTLGNVYKKGSRIPFESKSPCVVGDCPTCGSTIGLCTFTSIADPQEVLQWNGAREANKKNRLFFVLNPMPTTRRTIEDFYNMTL